MKNEENKSPEMARLLDGLAKAAFGRSRSDSIAGLDCVACGEAATEFTDELSKKEFSISGMCQDCQDGFFG